MLAPTGTIGFLMDCDTTGIEPDIALVKYKLLAGGGMFKIVNQTVKPALQKLGYNTETRSNASSRTSTTSTRLKMCVTSDGSSSFIGIEAGTSLDFRLRLQTASRASAR